MAPGLGEMAPWSRVLTALLEDLEPVASTHQWLVTPSNSSSRDLTFSSGFFQTPIHAHT